MTLLGRARDQFCEDEEVEREAACVYTEMGCEEEAARCNLRVVRCKGKFRAQALFDLSLSALQRGDIARSASYYQMFVQAQKEAGQEPVASELSAELGGALLRQIEPDAPKTRRARARMLERRAVERLQSGKGYAAARTLRHAVRLWPTARRYTLLACCALLHGQTVAARDYAKRAHDMDRGNVQALCVLADAYEASGEPAEARRALYLAAMRSRDGDDLFAVAMESAKHGEDMLTLRLTAALLRREPYHTQGMMLRACALCNLGKCEEAARLLARLCMLLPQDSICEAYFRMAREEDLPDERLDMGMDVPRQEGVKRASQLIAALYEPPEQICADRALLEKLCRYSEWAIRSPMAGDHATMVALIVLGALEVRQARMVLLDALTDPAVADTVKMSVLQILTAKEGFQPYEVDLGGRLVRLAAGAVSDQPVRSDGNAHVVQRVADALASQFPDAPKILLPIYLNYIGRYNEPDRKQESAMAAALEQTYYIMKCVQDVNLSVIARRYGASVRLCRVLVRRLLTLNTESTEEQMEERP